MGTATKALSVNKSRVNLVKNQRLNQNLEYLETQRHQMNLDISYQEMQEGVRRLPPLLFFIYAHVFSVYLVRSNKCTCIISPNMLSIVRKETSFLWKYHDAALDPVYGQ